MTFDLSHMAAMAAIVLIVLWLLKKFDVLEGASRGRRMLIIFAALFVPILILNVFWPYGG